MAWLIAGLGNPGDEYERTRHNAGRLALDDLAERHGARLRKARFQAAEADDVRVGDEIVWLVASTRFMNESGPTFASLASKHAIAPDHVVAVHDEIEIPADELMVKFGGGSAGHNGIRSLVAGVIRRFCWSYSASGIGPSGFSTLGRYGDSAPGPKLCKTESRR